MAVAGRLFCQHTETAMPVFHFNSLTGDMFLPDPEGEELSSISAGPQGGQKNGQGDFDRSDQERGGRPGLHSGYRWRRARGRDCSAEGSVAPRSDALSAVRGTRANGLRRVLCILIPCLHFRTTILFACC